MGSSFPSHNSPTPKLSGPATSSCFYMKKALAEVCRDNSHIMLGGKVSWGTLSGSLWRVTIRCGNLVEAGDFPFPL